MGGPPRVLETRGLATARLRRQQETASLGVRLETSRAPSRGCSFRAASQVPAPGATQQLVKGLANTLRRPSSPALRPEQNLLKFGGRQGPCGPGLGGPGLDIRSREEKGGSWILFEATRVSWWTLDVSVRPSVRPSVRLRVRLWTLNPGAALQLWYAPLCEVITVIMSPLYPGSPLPARLGCHEGNGVQAL